MHAEHILNFILVLIPHQKVFQKQIHIQQELCLPDKVKRMLENIADGKKAAQRKEEK